MRLIPLLEARFRRIQADNLPTRKRSVVPTVGAALVVIAMRVAALVVLVMVVPARNSIALTVMLPLSPRVVALAAAVMVCSVVAFTLALAVV
ncbi:MAG: hypothetical protein C0435_01215, partial [Ralstonia sp.]|nr:hypothetical protein [Ralstonia sp.]MBA4294632.1 hypothetical protein [Ralstonia sp.]